MALTTFNNKSQDGDGWFGQSFFVQQPARENSHRSIKPDAKNNNKIPVQFYDKTNCILHDRRLKKTESTSKQGIRSVRIQSAQSHAPKQSRSLSVRGAANISKETRLLKSKLDRLFASYQQTVVAASQSNATQLESLRVENQQLRTKLGELETETLRQFSELEDYEELIAAMEERRLSSQKETSMWKLECEKLANEVTLLKTTIEKHNQCTSGSPELRFRNKEKEKESLSYVKKSSNASSVKDEDQVGCNKENSDASLREYTSGETPLYAGKDAKRASLIAARGVFGNEVPTSFLILEKRGNDTNSKCNNKVQDKSNSHERKSIHAMTLRERQASTKYRR